MSAAGKTPLTESRTPEHKLPTFAALMLAAAIGVGQVSAYALNLVAAHEMGPVNFGELAALLVVLLVASVVALGVQAAGARRIVLLEPAERKRGSLAVLRSSCWAALVVAAIVVALTPLLVSSLHLSGPASVFYVAVATIPATIMGGQLGAAQGFEAHGRLASIYMLTGLGRAGGGIIGVLAAGTVVAATLGMAAGFAAAVIIGAIVIAPLLERPPIKLEKFRSESFHATHALLALFVLTNIDVLLARHYLPPHQAGMYAAGAVVAKVAFWLPQFVGVLAYPRMADERRAATLALASTAVVIIGSIVVAVVAVMPGLVVDFVGGSQYQALTGDVWVFAAEGAAFSLAQFLLYSQLAAGNRLAVVVLWGATALLFGLVVKFHGSVAEIVVCVLAVSFVVCAIGLADLIVERRQVARPAAS